MTGDEHLGWRISALLDGELGVTEEIVARRHLEGCDHCQQEFAEVMAARSLVRDLGEVEPPQGFLERVVLGGRSRFSPRLGVVGLVALAAAWILILAVGLGVALPDVTPEVDQFATEHADLAEASGDAVDLPDRTDGRELLDADGLEEIAAPFVAPDALDSLDRVGAYQGDGTLQVLYTDGEQEVSVFQQEGALDWTALPDTGERTELGSERAWIGQSDAGDTEAAVVILSRGDVVYTVVTETSEQARIIAETLPAPREYSLAQRTRRNLEGLARRLGFGQANPGADP